MASAKTTPFVPQGVPPEPLLEHADTYIRIGASVFCLGQMGPNWCGEWCFPRCDDSAEFAGFVPHILTATDSVIYAFRTDRSLPASLHVSPHPGTIASERLLRSHLPAADLEIISRSTVTPNLRKIVAHA